MWLLPEMTSSKLNPEKLAILCWINSNCPFSQEEHIGWYCGVYPFFGSKLFEDYISHLAMATMASSKLTSDKDNPKKLQDRLKVS